MQTSLPIRAALFTVMLALGVTTALIARAAREAAGPVQVSDAKRRTLAPELAIAPDGSINVIFLDRDPQAISSVTQQHDAALTHAGGGVDRHLSSMDLWFTRSTDGGQRFGLPVRINPQPGMVWGFAVSKPRIAVGRSGTLHVIFPANALGPDVDGRPGKPVLVMYYTRSTDGGASFEAPRLLHTLPAIDQSAFMDGGFSSAHAFATLGIAPNGTVHALWIDTRGMRQGDTAAAAYAALSRDDGATWSGEQVALPDAVCPCCQITLAFDAKSNLYVGSRQVTDHGTRNSTVARAPAGTSKLGAPVAVSGKEWALEGCPLKPTVLAVAAPRVYTAAYHGAESPAGVYFAMSKDGGATFGASVPVHPDAAVSDAPAIALVRGNPLLAWHGKTSGGRRIFWRSATRDGELGPVHELAAPAGTAQHAALAARADGRAQIVWQQGEQIMTMAIDPRSAAPSVRP